MPRLAVLSCFGCGILTFLLWIPLQTFLSGVCVAPLCPFRDASFITFLYWLMLDDYHWFSLDSMMESDAQLREVHVRVEFRPNLRGTLYAVRRSLNSLKRWSSPK